MNALRWAFILLASAFAIGAVAFLLTFKAFLPEGLLEVWPDAIWSTVCLCLAIISVAAARALPAKHTTAIALAAGVGVIVWVIAAFGIAGVWLDCIPNDREYGCPTAMAAWERTIGLFSAAAVLTVFIWFGVRRLIR